MSEFGEIICISNDFDVLDSANYTYDKANLSLVFFEQSKILLLRKTAGLIEKSPAFLNFLESVHPQQVFDVNMSNKAREMYEKGEWVLKYSSTKDGLIPILSDTKGKFVEQITLSSKNITQNLSSALSNIAMQQQLAQVMEQIESMNNTIKRVERGQRDDRIGLFYSARQQYIEAMSMTNEALQELALLNAARTSNDARFLMMQTMRSDIEQIIHNKQLKKTERDELSNNVRDSMQYINECTSLCMVCFSALGEAKPLLATAKSYQVFIEQTLLAEEKNGLTKAEMLHQNWNGSDDEWLQFPDSLIDGLNRLITMNSCSPTLIDKAGE